MKPERVIEILTRMRNRPHQMGAWDAKVTMAVDQAIEYAEKQMPKSPVPDKNATDRYGKPVPRCQVCGYAMDLQMEQYCPCCGQRLTEYEVEE